MRTLSKFLCITFLSLFVIENSYAITVSVHSSAKNIEGLGFTVNGAKHGGVGSTYHGTNMPKGSYVFGLRSHGKDIGCIDNRGNRSVKITRSSNATLSLNGRHCTVHVNS